MKYIIEGGITTKNIPQYSIDSIKISKNNENVKGISYTIKKTKDKIIVALPENSKIDPSTLSIDQVKAIDIGTPVKNQQIPTLTDILESIKYTNKILVLTLLDQKDENLLYVKKILSIINTYPNINIYIKTKSLEIFLMLKDSNTLARVGIIIDNNKAKNSNIKADFYSLYQNMISKNYILDKLTNNKDIMIENIKTEENLNTIKNELKEIIEEVFLITDNYNLTKNKTK